ncbi:hypothetical protein ACLOJK_024082 [Asimina triloba]
MAKGTTDPGRGGHGRRGVQGEVYKRPPKVNGGGRGAEEAIRPPSGIEGDVSYPQRDLVQGGTSEASACDSGLEVKGSRPFRRCNAYGAFGGG